MATAGDRVDRGRHREPLELGDDPGLGVLRDHVPAVDAGVVGQERRQPVAAGAVEEAVGAALADRGEVGHGDGEEVEHVAHRCAVEVAVGLHPAVGQSPPGCRSALASSRSATAAAWAHGVAHGAVHLRASSAASRRPARGCSRARGARRPRRSRPGSRRRLARATRPARGAAAAPAGRRRRPGRWPAGPRRTCAAATSATRSRLRRSCRASTSIPSMPSVPLISARPSLAAQLDRCEPGLGQRGRGLGRGAVGSADRALADERERAVRQRREVAGAAERAVLVDDRGDAVARAGRPSAARSAGRMPVRPVARVDSRSSIRARVTSRSTSGPLPAAWERISDRCSCGAHLRLGMCRVARAPNPVEMPYAGVGAAASASTAARDVVDRRRPRRPSSRTAAPWRATATTSARPSGPVPTRPGARDGAGCRPRARRAGAPWVRFHRGPAAGASASDRGCLGSETRRLPGWEREQRAGGDAHPARAAVPGGPARAGAAGPDRARRAPCPAPPPTTWWRAMVAEGFVVHLAEEHRYGLGRGGLRGRQRLQPPGAAGAHRPSPARPPRRRGRAQRPPRRPARARRALRGRGACARPAAAGHRRRRTPAGPPDRQRAGDPGRPARGPGAGALPRPVGLRRHGTGLGPASPSALRALLVDTRRAGTPPSTGR